MKILDTYCDTHRNKRRTKEDILDIGRTLKIFEDGTHFCINDKGILYTWRNSYNNDCIIYDINCIVQVLRIIQEEFHLPRREA